MHAFHTLYETSDDYQLVADNIRQLGDGLLQQKCEQLKQHLSNEGLFDQYHKQALLSPAYQVGVIISIRRAPAYDICKCLNGVLLLPVVIYLSAVQG